jgi:hypothetical protein
MNNCNSRGQIATFTKLQLVNLYGKNVFRNLKDPKEKRKFDDLFNEKGGIK